MASAARSIQKLFVGNIPWTVGHIELRDFFREFGHVIAANVVFDKTTGCSRGYGFITFAQGKGDQPLQKLEKNNRLLLEGQFLVVHPVTDRIE